MADHAHRTHHSRPCSSIEPRRSGRVGVALDTPEPLTLEIVIERHGRLVASAVRRVVGHHADVDDLVQETWITYLRCGDQIVDSAAVGGWLYRVATRLAIRAQQRNGRSVPHPDVTLLGDRTVDTSMEADVLWAQRRAAVVQAAGTLRERDRQVIAMLFDDDDLGYREISERLGVPIGSIGPTRERVIRRLREIPSLQRLGDEADADLVA